jgi:predicted ester cyclase
VGEYFEPRRVGEIERFIAEDFTNFVRPERGPGVWRQIVAVWRTAFPDVRIAIDEEILDGTAVVHRVTARGTHLGELRHPGLGVIPATGRQAEWDQIHIFHVVNGKIVSHWGTRNDVRMLQQIGMLTAPGGAWWEHTAGQRTG